MTAPLAGLRIADFSRVIAGPVAAMTLADLGADVVKIEHPNGGDDARGFKPPDFGGLSATFLSYNRNKRSIVLDLATDAGKATARRLVDAADVVIENFSTGVMERFGLGHGDVSAGRDDLIYCSISAYGRDGAFQRRAGYDPVVQAESGFMSLTGDTDRPPVRTGVPMIDVITGHTAAMAVLAAVLRRRRTARGGFIEVPLFDVAFALTAEAALTHLATGDVPARLGNADRHAAPAGCYALADGIACLHVPDDAAFARLAAFLEVPGADAFALASDRLANRVALDILLAPALATATLAELQQAGIAAVAVASLPDAFAADGGRLTARIPHADLGDVPGVGSPLWLERTGTVMPGEGPPLLGRQTASVLGDWLSLTGAEMTALADAGAFPAEVLS